MFGDWWQKFGKWREKRRVVRYAIDDTLWAWTLLRYPFLYCLETSDQTRLRRLCSLFLAGKEFHGAQDFVVTDEVAVAVAAQACLPVLNLDLSLYDGFVGIVMHAGEVRVRREFEDEIGVVHQYTDDLAGEATDGGPMMLSWQALLDAEQPNERPYNVVIHEFVHVLDMRSRLSSRLVGLSAAYEHFCHEVDAGLDTLIDPYGSESIEEFFAVSCETFFVAGRDLREMYPALYESLSRYFQQNPANRAL